jgi:hypothetical protein
LELRLKTDPVKFFRVGHGHTLPHAGVERLVKDESMPFYQVIRWDEWFDEQPLALHKNASMRSITRLTNSYW